MTLAAVGQLIGRSVGQLIGRGDPRRGDPLPVIEPDVRSRGSGLGARGSPRFTGDPRWCDTVIQPTGTDPAGHLGRVTIMETLVDDVLTGILVRDMLNDALTDERGHMGPVYVTGPNIIGTGGGCTAAAFQVWGTYHADGSDPVATVLVTDGDYCAPGTLAEVVELGLYGSGWEEGSVAEETLISFHWRHDGCGDLTVADLAGLARDLVGLVGVTPSR